jgi:predicted dehydrogenase
MKTIKIGVVGAGYWGPNLIRNFASHPDAELKAVCDLRSERLEHIRSLYPQIETTREYQKLLDADLDAVVIATSVSTHHRLALDFLNAGKHVLVEKPIAHGSQQALEIIQLARERNRIVMAGHTFLYNPAVQLLSGIIASGELGRIYYINCTRVNLGLYQPDINVIWDLAPHDISILMHVIGQKPEMVSARGNSYLKPGIIDVAYLTLYFPNGVMADLRLSWLDPVKIRTITFVGSRKMIVYDDIEPVDKLKIHDKGVDIQPYTDTFEEFHLAYRYGEAQAIPLKWQEPLRVECDHFLECIRQEKNPLSDGESGRKVIQVIEAAERSLLQGGAQEAVLW